MLVAQPDRTHPAMADKRIGILIECEMGKAILALYTNQLRDLLSNRGGRVRKTVVIPCQASNLYRAGKLLIDPLARIRIVAFVFSSCQIAKECKRLTHRRLCSNGLQYLQNLLFQFWRNLIDRYIRSELVIEPKRSPIQVK